MPVLQGPLRGARWIVGSSTHGCWLGSYEMAKQLAFASRLAPGQVVYDLGANVGFYTVLAARGVGSAGQVHAFEPLPDNVKFLRRHVELNQLKNVSIHACAVSNVTGKLRFAFGGDRSTGRLDDSGSFEVDAITLDEFVFSRGSALPCVIKIDVEGAELCVLEGARQVLEKAKPAIFLATHGDTVRQACYQLLRSFHYRVCGVDGKPPDQTDELLCIGGE